jgi:A/G-specific adenine glycosylase
LKEGVPAEAAHAAKAGRFARRLLAWHRAHGRRGLPWQGERDPYRVWISEIMLQQTRVATALPYFERFIRRFPDVHSLARAPIGDVMAAWAGLGYYARARNLHACARAVVARHDGRFPGAAAALAQLPGIGRSTAAAIAAFCFGERAAVLDANVKRVVARHWAIAGDPRSASTAKCLWERAQCELPSERDVARYTQAIMDLGATVCTRKQPGCDRCPVNATCAARESGVADALPEVQRRRARPVRTAFVLAALAGTRVLLQRRKGNGIWGGLMCLPEFGSLSSLARRARRLGASTAPPLALPPRRHALTHLTLQIAPYLVVTGRPAPPGAAGRSGWVALDQIDKAGLPAAHRALLNEVRLELRSRPLRRALLARAAKGGFSAVSPSGTSRPARRAPARAPRSP